MFSLIQWACYRIVRDPILDARDLTQWGKERIPAGLALFLEKWISFWSAIVLVTGVGLVGTGLVEAARWATETEKLANTIPWIIVNVGILGVLIVLIAGLGFVGILLVSTVRLARWTWDLLVWFWNRHTPRYSDPSEERDPAALPWPPSTEEFRSAREKSWRFSAQGALWFIVAVSSLLYLEMRYPEVLYGAFGTLYLLPITDVVNANFWLIDIGRLLVMIAPNDSQIQLTLFVVIFVIPGIWFVFAARNLVFVLEAYSRTRIERVRENGVISSTSLHLLVLFIFLTGVGGSAGYTLIMAV